jgi:hypothetical protein
MDFYYYICINNYTPFKRVLFSCLLTIGLVKKTEYIQTLVKTYRRLFNCLMFYN